MRNAARLRSQQRSISPTRGRSHAWSATRRPQFIVNAGAYTAVDRAETERELAFAINGDAPGVLAAEALRAGAVLIHYSTDYVFDGTRDTPYDEDAPTNPAQCVRREQARGRAGDRARRVLLR